MSGRYASLLRLDTRLERYSAEFEALFDAARAQCPDGFPFDETRSLDAVRDRLTLGFVEALRRALGEVLALPLEVFSLDRFTVQGAGPVSLHDDARNYPNVYFVIVVAHSGRLGIVDGERRAVRHAPGEVLLLDPRRKHALVPEGMRGADWPCARTPGFARDPDDQFLFLDFEVPRWRLRERFRLG
ncbi:MAG: hypothetical protein DI596_05075 [Azospira oryzae]|nr:MAG: hypothetical protein DI596_05075 [Azospira oryzae]PZP81029.1 MAG: hypothetical protein DI593_05075 [Azospira oryzae]